jgi:putative Holliday junction resolvase|tara:strand:+ start:1728 stop:2105 length:378 start_codon:yes stop_codon:yes gene_type:complete
VKNIIAIDYGERFIGLAIKKKSLNTPYPLKVLDSKDINILSEIKKILEDNNIEEIVVGYPIGLNNHETRMTKVVDEFISKSLSKISDLPVFTTDERMTSKIINDKKQRTDDLAAVEILNSYLLND